MFQLAASRVKK